MRVYYKLLTSLYVVNYFVTFVSHIFFRRKYI